MFYDKQLKGTDGEYVYEVDAKNHIVGPRKVRKSEVDGQDVRLTIDSKLQSGVYHTLKHAANKYEARGGGADIIKKMKGAGGTDIKPPVKHDHPVTVAYDNEVLKAQKPLPGGQPPQQDLPSFDAGAMVSMSKIKTLGISV